MSYEVLARKLRPAGFDALVGQDHVVKALRHSLDEGRLHHAYLFTGTRGVGKTTIARIVAKALNCEQGVSSAPCEQCSVCEEIRDNRFVDLIEVDAASRTGVDDTRDLLENAQYLPARGRYKVYLIDEVHMLSTASFNALLKTLEEPPEHVKFLLATTDPKKVPVTVLSRCLQFQLKNISPTLIEEYLAGVLSELGVEHDRAALKIIGRSARGSMRDALSLTDQAISYGQGRLVEDDVVAMLGVVGVSEIDTLMNALGQGDARGLLEVCRDLAERNTDFSDVLEGLTEALHHLAVGFAVGTSDGPEYQSLFDPERVQLYYQIALVGNRDLGNAPDPRSGFEMTMLRMVTFTPAASTSSSGTGSESGSKSAVKTQTQKAGRKASQRKSAPGKKSTATTPEPAKVAEVDLAGAVDASAGTRPDPQRWADLVAGLALGGVAKMIAEHANLVVYDLPRIELVLDEGHDTLLNDGQKASLQRGLSEFLGQSVTLNITVGATVAETPAEIRERIRAERQSQAEAVILKDAVVKDLLAEFDGQIEQIRPVQEGQ